jgi:hypothetical protein
MTDLTSLRIAARDAALDARALVAAARPFGWHFAVKALLLEQQIRSIQEKILALSTAPQAPRFSPVPLYKRSPAVPGGRRDLAQARTMGQ